MAKDTYFREFIDIHNDFFNDLLELRNQVYSDYRINSKLTTTCEENKNLEEALFHNGKCIALLEVHKEIRKLIDRHDRAIKRYKERYGKV